MITLTVIVLVICYFSAFRSDRKKSDDHRRIPGRKQYQEYKEITLSYIDDLDRLPHETLCTMSFDGLSLNAAYYDAGEDTPLAICMHGYKSSGIRDFCAGSRILFDAGFSILLPDQRGHGKSEGRSICFGIKEWRDVCRWAEMFPDRNIVLFGTSMGGSSVLMAADSVPSNTAGIIADSPYDSAREIIREVAVKRNLPARILMPFISLSARIFAGFSIDEKTASDAVSRSDTPVLIIHGDSDEFVPASMSEKIPGKRLIFKDADHCMSCMVHPQEYKKAVTEFIDKIIKER